jgi:homoserine kinase type II
MSVYTTVTEAELGAWLRAYPVGRLLELEPIAKGIENSNFFVTTTQGRYVLTLFERLAPEELPFYVGLMSHLARNGIPCPAPIESRAGALLSTLNGKPAALVTRLPGTSVETPTERHCAALGTLLARMHLAGRGFAGTLENPRGPKWWRIAAREVRPFLSAAQLARLDEELRFQSLYRFPDLPRGPVHADLFRDNALFEDSRLSGVIDFYFAGIDCLLYDCAVCANDWCLVHPADDRRLDERKMRALLEAYARERPFTALERGAWPVLLRAAALRFWLSRLRDLHLPRAGVLVHAHDPEHFETILGLRADEPAPSWPLA